MYSVELLNEAIDALRAAGVEVREEWLEGNGAGLCVLRGRRALFLDLNQPPRERLGVVLDALREEPSLRVESLPPAVAAAVRVMGQIGRRSA